MNPSKISISQDVAILIDGNNIERSPGKLTKEPNSFLNFDAIVPRLLDKRGLGR